MRQAKIQAISAIYKAVQSDLQYEIDEKKLAKQKEKDIKRKEREAIKYLKDLAKKAESARKKAKRDQLIEDTLVRVLNDESTEKIDEIISCYHDMDFYDDFETYCDYYGFEFHHYREWIGGEMLGTFIDKLTADKKKKMMQSY